MVDTPVGQGSHTLPCHDNTGPKPEGSCPAPFQRLSRWFAREPCHPVLWDVFRASQKFGQQNLLLPDVAQCSFSVTMFK